VVGNATWDSATELHNATGIRIIGAQPGTIIEDNHISEPDGQGPSRADIYLGEGISGVIATGNGIMHADTAVWLQNSSAHTDRCGSAQDNTIRESWGEGAVEEDCEINRVEDLLAIDESNRKEVERVIGAAGADPEPD
jgi:hypothetical protein